MVNFVQVARLNACCRCGCRAQILMVLVMEHVRRGATSIDRVIKSIWHDACRLVLLLLLLLLIMILLLVVVIITIV